MARADFARICHDTLRDWKAARRRVLDSGAGRGAVHQWRICTRRLLALEVLLAPHGPTVPGTSLAGETRDAFHASGSLRDAQLCERALREMARAVPDAARLARHQGKRMPRLALRLRRELRELRPARIARVIARWSDTAGGDPDEVLAARATQRLRRRRQWLTPAPDRRGGARSLHRQRLQLKQARYMIDLVRAAGLPPPPHAAPARLTALQAGLGAVTDLDTQLRTVARFAAKHPGWQSSARALRRELRARRAAALARLGIGTYSTRRAPSA
jgi:CHAD domain-containing protein